MTHPFGQTRRSNVAFGLALFSLACIPRLYVALAWAQEPVWDGHYYDFGARRIAAGYGYSDDLTIGGHPIWHPWCHYPVGYSAVLGGAYHLFGVSTRVAAALNAGIGAALAVVVWLLARHALSERRARLAGALVAVHPGLILYSALVMTEPLAALATLCAFWLAVRDRLPWRGLVIGSLALGPAALVRPQALLCAPFLAFVLPPCGICSRAVWRYAKGAICACACSLVFVIPWTARNCHVMDGCALVSTNGGWNLAIGAFPRATGRFETLRASDGCREVTGQVQQDRCWFNYGLQQIETQPGHWLKLIPSKLRFTFDAESFAVEYLHEARPGDWPDARRSKARDLLTFVHRMLVCVAAFAFLALRLHSSGARVQGALIATAMALVYAAVARGEPMFFLLVLFTIATAFIPFPGHATAPPALKLPAVLLATTALMHAVFFGEDRYHIVVTPVLCLFAAAALRRTVADKTKRRVHDSRAHAV